MMGKILIILSAVFGAIQLIFTKDKFARIILFAQVLAATLTFINLPYFKTTGFFLFVLTLITALIYTSIRPLTNTKKALMFLIILPVLTSLIFRFMHWPGGNIFNLLMIIPITAYFIFMFKIKNKKNEIGLLTMIVTEAIIEFSYIMLVWYYTV